MKTPLVSLRYFSSTTLILFAACFVLNTGISRADSTDDSGAQILTRGPVHEAFAAVIAFKPQPGVVVSKAPPEMIQEIPPDQKPEGENVTWIPGYWAWDDERNDFLWVSGVWRALPPGRQWIAGYWAQTGSGYQWTSGYWADANETKTTYLPEPPASLEAGPDVDAPADDYEWVPGSWIRVDGRYAWQPGYWIEGRDDWDWSPDYYVWTPRGYVFVDGYWDYSVERRGVLFAPVYFDSRARGRSGYRYSPAVVIDLGILPNHLFLRPGYQHYYFGDYYAAGYSGRGFYAAFSFQSAGFGYDPIFAHQRWTHRQDQGWEKHFESKYQYRRDHNNVRPPRTWAAQKTAASIPKTEDNAPVATSFSELSKKTGGARPFHPLGADEQQQFAHRGLDVQKHRQGRRALESSPASAAAAQPGTPFHPSSVEMPRFPIVSNPAFQRGREQAPPRPERNIGQRNTGPRNDDHGDHPRR